MLPHGRVRRLFRRRAGRDPARVARHLHRRRPPAPERREERARGRSPTVWPRSSSCSPPTSPGTSLRSSPSGRSSGRSSARAIGRRLPRTVLARVDRRRRPDRRDQAPRRLDRARDGARRSRHRSTRRTTAATTQSPKRTYGVSPVVVVDGGAHDRASRTGRSCRAHAPSGSITALMPDTDACSTGRAGLARRASG